MKRKIRVKPVTLLKDYAFSCSVRYKNKDFKFGVEDIVPDTLNQKNYFPYRLRLMRTMRSGEPTLYELLDPVSVFKITQFDSAGIPAVETTVKYINVRAEAPNLHADSDGYPVEEVCLNGIDCRTRSLS